MPHGPRFTKLTDDAKKNVTEVTVEDALQRQEAGETLLDVREAEEFAKEHAAGAVHLSRGILEVKIEERFPDPATRLVLYCGGGNRSALAAESLQKMGYANVVSVIGGFRTWKAQGLPTEG